MRGDKPLGKPKLLLRSQLKAVRNLATLMAEKWGVKPPRGVGRLLRWFLSVSSVALKGEKESATHAADHYCRGLRLRGNAQLQEAVTRWLFALGGDCQGWALGIGRFEIQRLEQLASLER